MDFAIATGPTAAEQVTLQKNERLLADAFRRCRRDVSSPCVDAHVKNLIKRVNVGRIQMHRQLLAVLFDAYTRHASRESVEAYGRTLLSIVGSWYDAGAALTDEELLTLVRRETARQSAGDAAELELMHERTPKSIADAADALDAHLIALEDLSAALHRRKVA